jgi:hypothetical protein
LTKSRDNISLLVYQCVTKIENHHRGIWFMLGPAKWCPHNWFHSGPVQVCRDKSLLSTLVITLLSIRRRIESNGAKGRIQSPATANLFDFRRQKHWPQEREDAISPKGRGTEWPAAPGKERSSMI